MRKKAVSWFGYLRMRKNHCGLAFQICACAKNESSIRAILNEISDFNFAVKSSRNVNSLPRLTIILLEVSTIS